MCAARTVAIRCRQPNKPGELGSYNSVSNNSVAGVAFKGTFKRCIQRRFAGGGEAFTTLIADIPSSKKWH